MEKLINIYLLVFGISIFMFMLLIALLIGTIFKYLKEKKESNTFEKFSDEDLAKFSEVEHDVFDKKRVLKQLAAPDGVNPDPLSYLVINDGGIDVYVRTFTILTLPNKLKFAKTWATIADYENAVTSIFIRPMTNKESIKQLDNHINVLEGEIIHASKPEINDRNRIRKLKRQQSKTEMWSERIDDDDDAFFKVGFLITLKAPSLSKLNMLSDSFHMEVSKMGGTMEISSCYGMQSEAYRSNLPFNRILKSKGNIALPVHWHLLNRKALASLYNHKYERFVHKDGVPVGRGLFNQYLTLWDAYDPSHTHGYSVMFCGPMGVGKSTLIKLLVGRFIARWDYKFVCIDSQNINGHGEYALTALMNNGTVFELKSGAKIRLNFFDIDVEKVLEKNKKTEKSVLDLLNKKSELLWVFESMARLQEADFATKSFVREAMQNAINEVYADKGIIDGNPDSLYEKGKTMSNGKIVSGKVKKKVPIYSDFMKKLIIDHANEYDLDKKRAKSIAISNMALFVEGLYYSEKSTKFFTKEEFYSLPEKEINSKKVRTALINGEEEVVLAMEGPYPFFDGESNESINRDCPFTEYDISSLPENVQELVRPLLLTYIEENFIKKNDEDISVARKMVVIFDEAKKHWDVGESLRKQSEHITRTCRKKNVGLWWSTQACADAGKYNETANIFKLSDVKFVFQQSRSDEEYLKTTLPLTEVQRERLYHINGTKKKGENIFSEPGEVCLIDGEVVTFLKVQILNETEEMAIETDMNKLAKKYGKEALYWNDQAV